MSSPISQNPPKWAPLSPKTLETPPQSIKPPKAPQDPQKQATIDPTILELTQEFVNNIPKKSEKKENQEKKIENENDTTSEDPSHPESPNKNSPSPNKPSEIHPEPHQDTNQSQEKIIEDCLQILENQPDGDDEDIIQQTEASQAKPAPPSHTVADPEALKTSLKEFAQARGYAIEIVEDQPDGDNNDAHQEILPPPNGIFADPEALKTSIKEFAQAHGYAIVLKRSVSGKSMMFKCDRWVAPFSEFLYV